MIAKIAAGISLYLVSSPLAAQAVTICDRQMAATIENKISDTNSQVLAGGDVRLTVVHSETAPSAGQYFLLVTGPSPSQRTEPQCRLISFFPNGVGRDGQGFMYLTLDGVSSEIAPNGVLIAKLTAAWWDRGDGGDTILTVQIDPSSGNTEAFVQ